ncbi:SCO2522 family protein [Actinomadura sp. RB99]|uniref:SCO2522 family protein n=1 Tax=Actinomadura sp. RB99 TaxID=2691577 RepID=UPI001F5143FA|nr:SCO2522 family protein [Actinomadura sp. RB99]
MGRRHDVLRRRVDLVPGRRVPRGDPRLPAGAPFTELDVERRLAGVPLSHVSIELGHLYAEDFERGPAYLRDQFERVRPWVETLRSLYERRHPGRRPRISTCFLIDDYFTRFGEPAEVIGDLTAAAADCDLRIDYLARESGCAVAGEVPLAEIVERRLVPAPPPGTDGSRPPLHEVGWLCNGERSTAASADEAMRRPAPWGPPRENTARQHSIFVDVELWSEPPGGRRLWSCAFLASVWQLLRLGLLRYDGAAVATPVTWEGDLPADWEEVPPILQLNPAARPFSAYRTMSVLDPRFLPVEGAVRTILDQVAVDDEVLRQIADRGSAESIELPPAVVDRIAYVFAGGF